MNPALRRSAAHVFVESLAVPVLDEQDRHHLTRVLRLRAGEVVTATDGHGSWRTCRFEAGGSLLAEGPIVVDAVPSEEVTVGFALPKADRPEWIVQKLTELGVRRMIVIEAERSVTRWDTERATRHQHKLGKVAREAAMQSRRTVLPTIDGPITLRDLVGAEPLAVGLSLAEPGGRPIGPHDRCVLVGPEGGWSPAELDLVEDHVALGDAVLRVETAALVAAALMTNRAGAG